MTDEEQDGDFFAEIDEGDYIFIIDVQGNLKSYALPESLGDHEEVPDSIEQIMKIFAASRSYTQQTIH
jgi:hypothetical protein